MTIFLVSFIAAFLIRKFGGTTTVEGKTVLSTSSEIGFLIAFLTSAGSFITTTITIFADALAPGRNVLGERVILGSGDPLQRFRKHFNQMTKRIRRPVLVVIDDIDRCRPEFIVELARGLQTILLSSRIVYLILGDRKWIEQAFEVQHEKMNQIDVGPEHTFGGRFVEKTIQLSFSLPAIADHQDEYVREVLMGRAQSDFPSTDDTQAGESNLSVDGSKKKKNERFAGVDSERRINLRQTFAEADSAEAIDKAGSELEKDSEKSGKKREERLYRQAVREEVILRRAAQKKEVKEAIQHRLEAIAEYLPSNPRHIKRIINAISMYQDSILLTQESLDDSGFGKRRWRELVIGVVLMMGFPKSWSLLATNPLLANYVSGVIKEEAENLDEETRENLSVLRDNEAVIGLLSQTKFYEEPGAEPAKTVINAETIQWLCQVIPMYN